MCRMSTKFSCKTLNLYPTQHFLVNILSYHTSLVSSQNPNQTVDSMYIQKASSGSWEGNDKVVLLRYCWYGFKVLLGNRFWQLIKIMLFYFSFPFYVSSCISTQMCWNVGLNWVEACIWWEWSRTTDFT